MPVREFWYHVRSAARLIAPKVVATSATLNAGSLESDLEKADLWLTPGAVEGFALDDFSFLSEEERRILGDCVARFLEVARQVPNRGAASETQVKQARSSFAKILELVRFDKYDDVDAFVLGKRLEQALEQTDEMPTWVRAMRFESGLDSIGERALWIYLMVDDEILDVEHPFDAVREVYDLVGKYQRRVSPDWYPFIHFRTVSEQRALAK